MPHTPDLKQALCLKSCFYYKPGKKEKLACQGYVIIERMMHRGMRFEFSKQCQVRDCAADAVLIETMCRSCPFGERDCDFMENGQLPPCGGFVLLAQLLSEDKLKLDDLK